jgi:hypothetical protein
VVRNVTFIPKLESVLVVESGQPARSEILAWRFIRALPPPIPKRNETKKKKRGGGLISEFNPT